jgi:tetratricopeptide (TPR) repeat protein
VVRSTVLLASLLAACGGSQTTEEVVVAAPVAETVAETTPVEVVPELTPEEVAAQEAAAAEAAWESAATLVRESVPGERPYADIVGLLETYIERNPTVAEAWFNLGLMKEEQGDAAGAREAYERAGQVNPGYARGLANLSWLQLQEGDVMGALATIRTCLSIKENEPGCNINLSLMYRRGDTTPDASDGTDPNSAAIRRIRYGLLDSIDAEAYTVMAEIYQEQGQLELARLVCENAVAQNLTSSRLWNRLGLIALAQDDPLRAYASFRESVAMDPSNLDAQLNVASMAFSFRDYPTAATAYAVVVEERDEDPILLAYGASLRGLEDYDGAVAQYERVLERNPTSLRAMYNMAVLMQEGRQDYAQACTYYRQYLADGGSASDAQYEDARRRFNSLSELTTVMAEMGEMDPAIAAACTP